MSVTTSEFENQLNGRLADMESWKRCEWCGSDESEKRIGPRSKLCDSCKEWKRKERLALEWQRENPDRVGKEDGFYYERCVQFAALCREEGHIYSWKETVTPFKLESELEFLTEKFLGRKDKISGTIINFGQFSDAQRRLMMYMLERIHKVWLQHQRRSFATDATVTKYLSGSRPLRYKQTTAKPTTSASANG